MAQPDQPGRNALTDLLYVLGREISSEAELTVSELLSWLIFLGRAPSDSRLEGDRRSSDEYTDERHLEAMLRQLAASGLVQKIEPDETGQPRWRRSENWRPPGEGGAGGGPPNFGPGDTAPPGDEDDGGGIRETLSHPILFALDAADFDDLLNEILPS